MDIIKTAIVAGVGSHAVSKLIEAQKQQQQQSQVPVSQQPREIVLPAGQGIRQVYYQDPNDVPRYVQQGLNSTRDLHVKPVQGSMDPQHFQQPGLLSDDSIVKQETVNQNGPSIQQK